MGNISRKSARLWCEIQTHAYNFSHLVSEVEAIRALRHEDVVEFFDTYIAARARNRMKVSIQFVGTSADSDSKPANRDSLYGAILRTPEDVTNFRSGLEVSQLMPSMGVPGEHGLHLSDDS